MLLGTLHAYVVPVDSSWLSTSMYLVGGLYDWPGIDL